MTLYRETPCEHGYVYRRFARKHVGFLLSATTEDTE